MEKIALVELLKKQGYEISMEGSIPILRLNGITQKQAVQLIRSTGYDSSFGLRFPAKNTKKSKSKESDSNKEEIREDESPEVEEIPDFQMEDTGQYALF